MVKNVCFKVNLFHPGCPGYPGVDSICAWGLRRMHRCELKFGLLSVASESCPEPSTWSPTKILSQR